MKLKVAETAVLEDIKNKLMSLNREMMETGNALPAVHKVGVDATDDEILAAVDYVGLSNIIRCNSGKILRSADLRPHVLAIARNVGLEKTGQDATIADLRERLGSAGHKAEMDLLDAVTRVAGWTNDSSLEGKFDGKMYNKLCIVAEKSKYIDFDDKMTLVMNNLQAFAISTIEKNRLSDSFSGRLRGIMRQSGLSIEAVAVASGICAPTLRNWLDGHSPRPSQINNILKMATVLGVPTDTLLAGTDMSPPRMVHPLLDNNVRADFNRTGIPTEFLDGGSYAEWPMEQRISHVYEHIIGATAFSQYSKAVREHPISYCDLNQKQSGEWALIREFKTASLPMAAFPRQKIVPIGNGMQKVYGGSWRSVSADLVNHKIRQSISAVRRVIEDKSHHDHELASACASAFENCGLGVLASTDFHRIALTEIARRRYENMKSVDFFAKTNMTEPEKGEVYSYTDIHRLYLISGLFSSETGWFYHNQPEVNIIPGVCDQAWVEKAEKDWSGTVALLQSSITNMIAALRKSANLIRDPKAPIAGLLALDDPLSPLYAALERMEKDRPSASGNLVSLARHDLQFLVVALIIHTRLRRANYPRLTYLSNNTGHLRRVENRWVLNIPRGELKNEHSSAIEKGQFLDLELDHNNATLNKAIERWIGKVDRSGNIDHEGSSRALLHGNGCGKYLFPGNASHGQMAAGSIGGLFRQFVAYYLAECPWRGTGIANVHPFGVHAIRDLTVTFVLRKGGSFYDAARMIWDTEKTVRDRYSHFSNIDRSRANTNFMNKHISW